MLVIIIIFTVCLIENQSVMFNADFYPTPDNVIYQILDDLELNNKTVLEPSAGKGNIIDVLHKMGATVLCCENDPDLSLIASSKAKLIAHDFLSVESHQVSHIDYIVMNPPFSSYDQHINHAWDIAPEGCEIIALCNWETLHKTHLRSRRILKTTIDNYGYAINLGDCFSTSERRTGVEIGLIRLSKPGQSADFGDYFTDEDDESEKQENGLMSYNAVREIVQRYVNAVKLYDDVLENAVKMNGLTNGIGVSDIVFTCSQDKAQVSREEFAKELQKKSWTWVINKMNLKKYSTRGLTNDINKFVEQQTSMKFTMKNIYRMLDAIVQTTGQRMDKALLEVFDTLTQHYHENRWNVEGWKTNSHYLVNKKFIKPYLVSVGYSGGIDYSFGQKSEELEDMVKALCFLSGENYDEQISFYQRLNSNVFENDGSYKIVNSSWDVDRFEENNPEWKRVKRPTFGEWFDWGFFEVKVFKKGTGHFKFKDEKVWGLFNQQIARIKGFPLPESMKTAA